jgi:hypothetical protein
MPSNFNDSTPAAPAGSLNVAWQTDGAGNDSAYYTAPFDIPVYNKGVGVNGDVLFYGIPTRAIKFPSGAASSKAVANTAATGTGGTAATFTFKKGGSAFATCVFDSGVGGGLVGTWTQASDATFNGTSDVLEVDGPATADTTLANFSMILRGYRT